MSDWKQLDGHLGTPRGFRAAAVAAGIKRAAADGGQARPLDLCLIFSDAPQTTAAGVFTTNLAAAAPVILSRRHLEQSRGRARAVVANSGNANACTGAAGLRVARQTASQA